MEDAREHLTVHEPGKEGRRTFTADGNKVLLFHVRNDILNQTHCLKFQTHRKTAVGRVGYKDLHYFNQTSFNLFLPTFKRKPFLMVVVSEIDCAG